MKCPNCGKEIANDSRFCEFCGTKIVQKVDGTHVFNEENKRLEPVDNICVFCGERRSEHPEDNIYMPLYKESDRLNVVVYRKVSYKKIDIGLARCPHCKGIHQKQKNLTWVYTIIGGILAMVLLSIFTNETILSILLGIAISAFIWLIVRAILEKSISRREKILTKQEAAAKYPIVQTLLAEGWTFDQPTA